MKNTEHKLTLAVYLQRRGTVKALTRIEAEAFGIPYPSQKGWARQYGALKITAPMLDDLRTRIARANPSTAAKAQRGLDGIASAELSRAEPADHHQGSVTMNQASTPETPVSARRGAVILSSPPQTTRPVLNPLEAYAGIVQGPDLVARHLILLPGDVRVQSIEDAEEFAASVGGVLPTHAELMHLLKSCRDLFKSSMYYTCEQEEYDGDMASVILDFATPAERDAQGEVRCIRARAVRHVLAQDDTGPIGGINGEQVAAIANILLEQQSADGKDDEAGRLVGSGVRIGIAMMETAVKNALAARKRYQAEGLA